MVLDDCQTGEFFVVRAASKSAGLLRAAMANTSSFEADRQSITNLVMNFRSLLLNAQVKGLLVVASTYSAHSAILLRCPSLFTRFLIPFAL